jgi:sugar phosphate isomerase/epimerase
MSWRIGASTGACIHRPIAEVLEAFHAVGVKGVELGSRPDHFDTANPDCVADVSARLRALSLQPVSIHAPFGDTLDLSDPDAALRARAVEAVTVAAAALKHAGGRIVVVHPTDRLRDGQDVGARLDAAVKGLTVVAERCRQEGLTLALESPLPHLIGGRPDEFAQILRGADPSLKVCLDTGHTFLGGAWDEFLAVAGQRLVHVHASDNHGTGDDHLPPGDGRIDWTHVVSTLHGVGFTGWIMLELSCRSDDVNGYFANALGRADSLRMEG